MLQMKFRARRKAVNRNRMKVLYSSLLARTGLSYKNDWLDEDDGYIFFTVIEIMEIRNKSNQTADKILNELDLIAAA